MLGKKWTSMLSNVPDKKQDLNLRKSVPSKFPRVGVVAKFPNEIWSMDLMVMNKSDGEYKNAIVAVDVYSRSLYLEALKTRNANDIKNGMDNIFTRSSGPPKTIWIDKEGAFIGHVMNSYLKTKGVESVYFAQGGGSSAFAESMIKQVRMAIVAKTNWDKNNSTDQGWVALLPEIEKQFNNTVHTTTNISPNDAMKGKDQGALATRHIDNAYRGKDTTALIKHLHDDKVLDKRTAPLLDWKYKQLKEQGAFTKLDASMYHVGDIVKAPIERSNTERGQATFVKGYEKKWSSDDFVICDVRMSAPVMYGIYNLTTKKVAEGRKYTQQLMKTGKKATESQTKEAVEAFKQTVTGVWNMSLLTKKDTSASAKVWVTGPDGRKYQTTSAQAERMRTGMPLVARRGGLQKK